MTERAPEGLVLRLTDYERQPEHPIDCLEFLAEASTTSFRGRTRFSIYKRDLDVFLEKLDTMAAKLSGEASIKCGWGDNVFFELKASYFGRRGQISVELEVANTGPRQRMQRLLVDFSTEPELLSRFTAGLRRTAEHGDTTPVHLSSVNA